MQTKLFWIFFIVLFLILSGRNSVKSQDISARAYGVLNSSGSDEITAIDISSDNKFLLTGDSEGSINLFDIENRRLNQSYSAERDILFISFIGERSFMSMDERGNIKIFDIASNRLEREFSTRRRPELAAIDRTKRFFAIANSRRQIELFDLVAMMPAGQIDARNQIKNLIYLDFDRLGQQLIAITENSEVYSWNPATLSLLRNLTLRGDELYGSQNVVKSASSNTQSNIFAVGLQEVALPRGGLQTSRDLNRQNYIIGYDWNSGIEIRRVNLNWEVNDLVMGPGSSHITATSRDTDNLYIIDMQQGEIIQRVRLPDDMSEIAVPGTGRYLIAGSENGKIHVWNLSYNETRAIGGTKLPSISGRVRALSSSNPLFNENEYQKISLAILNIESRGIQQDVADIAMFSMSNSLSNVGYLELVERSQIEQIIAEQEFQLGDLTQDEGVRIGQILNVDYVLLTTMGKLGENVIVNGRVVSVETGQVIGGREVICETCQDQDILDAVSMLSNLIAE